ncbi:ATP-binding protein [Herbaspirillum huttiense F1]|uniref:histidine kinase n=1 Tax=Herbaspirillum huttiense subsp. lycopersici TaxID=3074428 RepID=A0ABU2EJF3_9BURK|nr:MULTISPECIES: ATP-binding protein [Herbaspirillum]MDR9848286.1 ATP-binding protein [Herbaspirillum huttiense SE1]MDT0356437.1 ATP-binding protein [Herbaspirillum huttiense F1]
MASKQGGSMGLGLYIVREVASAHGGSVAVRSSADEGTTFTIRLPKDQSRSETVGKSSSSPKLNFLMCLDYLLIRREDGHISNPFALRINGMSLRELDNSFTI